MFLTVLTAKVAPCNTRTRSPSCWKGLGLWEENPADHFDHGHCLPAASQGGTAEPSLAFLHNMEQETGLSRVISQHSLASFPGCFPGPLCYAVKALHACDHGDKTNHDGSAVKGSRLCKTSIQVCLVLSSQLPDHATKRQNGFPGIGCQVSHALPVTQLSGRRKKKNHYLLCTTFSLVLQMQNWFLAPPCLHGER